MSNDRKPDFSNVQGGVKSTEPLSNKPDFGNVQSKVTSTEEITGGSGGAGSTGERSYTVESGDTLSHIAKAQYGKASKWRRSRQDLPGPGAQDPGDRPGWRRRPGLTRPAGRAGPSPRAHFVLPSPIRIRTRNPNA